MKALRTASLLFTVLGATSLAAQGAFSLGWATGEAGSTVLVPLSAAGPPSVRGIAFKILLPEDLVASASFTPAGLLAFATPVVQTTLQGPGWLSYIALFEEQVVEADEREIGTLALTLRADAPRGRRATLRIDAASAILSNAGGTSTETVANGRLALQNGELVTAGLLAPETVSARADGVTQVVVSWSTVWGAGEYEIWRSSHNAAFAMIGVDASAPFTDSDVSAGTTYLYMVRARAGAEASAFSNIDAATPVAFTDDPLVARTTRVKAVHLTELRAAVDAMRAAAGMAPLPADPTVATGGVIRAAHITTLRTALSEARSSAGLPALPLSELALVPGAPVRAVHVEELRAWLR
jgi:hypothetical protein